MSNMGSVDNEAANQCNSSLPPILNGIKEGTFVTYTIAERWPKTLAKVVDHVHCKRKEFMEQYGPEADADVKSIIHELSELRYRIMTDKPLEDLTDTAYHYDMWNKLLADLRKEYGEEQVTWYRMSWLFTECFLYRKVVGAVAKTKYLKDFDIYREQKVEAFNGQ
ncbi:unnamed protein product [Cylicostephanus goldi]|uniref:Sugar phosphate phosphatase n=1 Tax=Cylicostephanus goldi TaxID=71465 RepID=A0A3P6RT30_CYLGO|nr:unnamed protein product [Cylicostephanus goldi]